MEKLVQYFRVLCQQIIQVNRVDTEPEKKADQNVQEASPKNSKSFHDNKIVIVNTGSNDYPTVKLTITDEIREQNTEEKENLSEMEESGQENTQKNENIEEFNESQKSQKTDSDPETDSKMLEENIGSQQDQNMPVNQYSIQENQIDEQNKITLQIPDDFIEKIEIKKKSSHLKKLSENEEARQSRINELASKNELNITLEEARQFHKNTNMLHFIRRYILYGQNKTLFKNSLDDLTKTLEENQNPGHPAYIANKEYNPSVQDLGLLMCIAEHGFGYLDEIENSIYGFEKFDFDKEKLSARVDFLCDYFKNQHDKTNLKKRKVDKNFKDESKKKYKNVVTKNENGEIVFPIVISSSQKLLNLGTIKPGPFYHSEHNQFPVGYTSIRTYSSIFTLNKKADYTCEIIDGGDKPLYRVTSSEDPANPIVRESSTGCWVYICRRVNDLQENKKQKVTISGTERFGQLEMTVAKLLEGQESSEKCEKYVFKTRAD